MYSWTMDNEARLRMSLDYIESHLEEELTLPDIAAQAWFSAYHFHRIFLLHTGYTVMDYVRQRR